MNNNVALKDSIIPNTLFPILIDKTQENISFCSSSVNSTNETIESNVIVENTKNSNNISNTSLVFPESITDSSISERIYKKTDESYDIQLTKQFIDILSDDVFESGYTSNSEDFILQLLDKNPIMTKDWICRVFYEYFTKDHYVIGILHLLSHIDYVDIYPQAQIIAIASLSHQSVEVREFAIKAFENWGQKDSLSILKKIKCNENWLQDYLDQVILSLERE